MTARAREVLSDCKAALGGLTDGIQGIEWKLRWIVLVVLMRAVGHVLKKVDARVSENMRVAIEQEWTSILSSKPNPQIYWGFIEQDRNTILKEYEVNAGQGVSITMGAAIAIATLGGAQSDRYAESKPSVKYIYTIRDGAFAGRDQREVASEAIAWWESYLDRIDRKAGL